MDLGKPRERKREVGKEDWRRWEKRSEAAVVGGGYGGVLGPSRPLGWEERPRTGPRAQGAEKSKRRWKEWANP